MASVSTGPAASGGGIGAPTPWWQLPGQGGALTNLTSSAPAGYQYDPVQMNYVPVIGSATDALTQRARTQGIEDKLLSGLTGFGGTGAAGADIPFSYSGGGGGSAGGGGMASVPYTYDPKGETLKLPAIPTIQAPDTSAAQAAIFARAKDQVGQETSGSLAALRSALAARGMAGSGAEVKGTSNVLTSGQGQLGDTTREQAVQEAQRQNDFAKLGYQGAIEQRGQDITTVEGAANRALAAANAQFSGQIAERGQDVTMEEGSANRGLSAAQTGYQGLITQRGQDITANQGRLGALTTLMSKLY